MPISHWLAECSLTVSPLVAALLLGLLVAQFRPLPAAFAPGLSFASRTLLRAAVVLLGLRIGLRDIAAVGWGGVLLMSAVVASTLGFALWLGRRLGLSAQFALLLAAGHAICGAAAVAAMDSIVRAKEAEVVRALALITIAGTLVMLGDPLLGAWLQMPVQQYGFWVGGSVHEVAQAVGAGYALGDDAGQSASLWKMVRVAHLLPVGALVAWVMARKAPQANSSLRGAVPWFVVGFAALATADALGMVPGWTAGPLRALGNALMTVAMAALGLKSSLRDLGRAGSKPLALAAATTAFVGFLAWAAAQLRA